jgi:adenosylcobinamide kinase / adenosylcobinamide-phosphate guanylyltransferase
MVNILLTGGVRSGKSDYAEKLAKETGNPILFVATAVAFDEEMRKRIEAHKKSRPSSWRTLEVTEDIAKQISINIGDCKVVILDCITVLTGNLLSKMIDVDNQRDHKVIFKKIIEEIEGIIECMEKLNTSFIIVTNEVGMGVVPDNPMGRFYRDLLGKANQLLADRMDRVYLMVSGIPVKIK